MSNPRKVIIKPIIIANRNNRQMVITPKRMTPNLILSNLKVASVGRYREDVIYESSNCDFLKGESQRVLIVNKVNIATKTCRTVAKCTANGVSVETTSDDVCSLIGQNNYDTVLSALGSVFNEETKVRGILALLRQQTKRRTTDTQTEPNNKIKKEYADSSCQTSETYPDTFGRQNKRKRIRRQYTPYVVKDVKKCVINIDDVVKKEDLKKEAREEPEEKVPELPDIKAYVDEDSNISCGSNMTSLSNLSYPELLAPCKVEETLNSIQTCTLNVQLEIYDGTNIMIPVKPEDEFHLATRDILKNVTSEERIKLLYHQALIDFKKCLECNEDGYYPLHIAALHSDVDLVRRQCLALRWRMESVDIPAAGMTALQMAVQHNSAAACTAELLRRGADPLRGDAERRSALHRAAAAADLAHLQAILEHCDRHPREVLKSTRDLWKPQLVNLTERDLVAYLYEKIGELFDDQGNTPLMVAAFNGRSAAAELLGVRCRAVIDTASPACGSTALYRAVAAACVHAKDNGGSDNVPENLLRTAEVLVSHGADPGAENHSGSSVNSLLQESTIATLSMRIVNAMPDTVHGKPGSNMILVKDKNGRIVPEHTNRKKARLDDETLKRMIEARKKRTQEMANLALVRAAKSFKGASAAGDSKSGVARDINIVHKLYHLNSNREASGLNYYGITPTNASLVNNKETISNSKISGLKLVSNQMKPADKSRIVIVENVSVNTEFSKFNMPMANVVTSSKPKDIVLVSPSRKDAGSPKFVRIAPKHEMDVDSPAPGTSKAAGRQ